MLITLRTRITIHHNGFDIYYSFIPYLQSELKFFNCAGHHDPKYLDGLAVLIYMEHKAGLEQPIS